MMLANAGDTENALLGMDTLPAVQTFFSVQPTCQPSSKSATGTPGFSSGCIPHTSNTVVSSTQNAHQGFQLTSSPFLMARIPVNPVLTCSVSHGLLASPALQGHSTPGLQPSIVTPVSAVPISMSPALAPQGGPPPIQVAAIAVPGSGGHCDMPFSSPPSAIVTQASPGLPSKKVSASPAMLPQDGVFATPRGPPFSAPSAMTTVDATSGTPFCLPQGSRNDAYSIIPPHAPSSGQKRRSWTGASGAVWYDACASCHTSIRCSTQPGRAIPTYARAINSTCSQCLDECGHAR